MLINNEKFNKKVEQDLTFESHNFDEKIKNHPRLLNRYDKLLRKRISTLKEQQEKYDTIYMKKFKYYVEDYDPVLQQKQAEKYTQLCPEVKEQKKILNEIQQDIDYLSKKYDEILQMYWDMKLWLQYQEWIKGER